MAQLDAIWEVPVLLVTAPAGFGKTTLLAHWARSGTNPARVAWLALEAADNDPVRFWAYAVAALQRIRPDVGIAALALLQAPQPAPSDVTLAALVNELADAPGDLALVLDDFHTIEAPAVQTAVAALIEQSPPGLHLVLASRTDPPLPMARLHARGLIAEIRAPDLSFTDEEVAAFLSDVMDLHLRGEHVAALAARTEGWPAGLQLAALALQARRDQDLMRITDSLGPANHDVIEFLVAEVFSRQPPRRQEFLLCTAVLDRMCGPLCEAVTGQPEAAETLEALEQANLFLVPLDDAGQWYRYHHLFGDMLRARLRKREPTLEDALNRRAAAWCEAAGFVEEAVQYCLRADAFVDAARLIEDRYRVLIERGEVVTLHRWLEILPDDIKRSRARLGLACSWSALAQGRLEEIAAHLQAVDDTLSGDDMTEAGLLRGELAVLRAVLASLRMDLAAAIAEGEAALVSLPTDDHFLRGLAAFGLGNAQLWSGDLASARRRLDEAAGLNRLAGNAPIALASLNTLALLAEAQSRLHDAAALYKQVFQTSARGGHSLPLVGVATAEIGLGGLLREWNDLDSAADALQRGIELGNSWASAGVVASGYIGLARVLQARGDLDGALSLADQAETAFERAGIRQGVTQTAAFRALLRLTKGDSAAASVWATSRYEVLALPRNGEARGPLLDTALEFERLVFARILAARGDVDQAEELLAAVLQSAEATQRTASVIKILALQAVSFHVRGRLQPALAALGQALLLARPGGHVRLFLDEGPGMANLLRDALARRLAPDYVAMLLAAFSPTFEPERAAPPGTSRLARPLIDPLTAREHQVLRLLAAGRSNAAIAEELVVVVGTVKRHLNSAYGKLGAVSRTQAVARARELGLL